MSKTTITFNGTRRDFAGARPKSTGLSGYLDLQRGVQDPRIRSVAPYTSRLFVHRSTVSDATQLDATFAGWIRAAYVVGRGDHLTARSSSASPD